MKLNQREVQHLLLRAGFGDSYEVIKSYINKSPDEILEDQFKKGRKPGKVAIDTSYPNPGNMREMSDQNKQMMRKQARADIRTLNTLWVKEMVNAPSSLNEKMAFFWHDHFACKSQNPIFMQGYLDAIRKEALGNFGDLLRAISKSPAMLQYLNNQQNRKQAPNENFAREVMELFTLGRDQNYNEKDISEAARAFTGWSFDSEGNFMERSKWHDEGTKSILGKIGNFKGDDVLDLLLKNMQTARYISQKWVAYFVNHEGNTELERKVADALYNSDYDIKTGLKVMFFSDEFYKHQNIGSRIKSPIELIVSMQRQLQVSIEDEDSLIFLQRMMGQVLFDPPNVAGWPDGKDWVDSASLMFRVNLPELVFKAAVIQNQPEASFDDNDQFKIRGRLSRLETRLDLDTLKSSFENDSAAALEQFLLQDHTQGINVPSEFLDQIVYFTSKPEYQLC
ncbi:DUF1800 family protein [Marinoscillum sp. MHG1-6]|uniref:DUF1800 domain-containing protein n=1 Tax=Marinoscillum sp. MHG1-6 TaxID=2959627 RepID=UPI00215828BC|nr:DUF1800 domain-containing protein [Marinoscillum sp. MHG1-6]